MDTLNDTSWDLVIRGTGLEQSLVALALSRSHKKILHLDRNEFYGGPDAALSLQEAEAWVRRVNEGTQSRNFEAASMQVHDTKGDAPESEKPGLSFSRAYSLSLSPQIIYTRSELLGCLVSSKVYRQLEFLALGSWWVYEAPSRSGEASTNETTDGVKRQGRLQRVPSGREDIFEDDSIDPRSKRSLMKFLKFVAEYEEQRDVWDSYATVPFGRFLEAQFGLAPELQKPLLAICMAPDIPDATTTDFALPRIARHLRSIGMFGPGFGAVIAKWGGGAEIAQVACRAGAVGGAVYMLGNDVDSIGTEGEALEGTRSVEARLHNGDRVRTGHIVEMAADPTPAGEIASTVEQAPQSRMFRSISIVSSALTALFPVSAEGAPQPAGAVVVFPPGSLPAFIDDPALSSLAPVHIIVHASETGECPAGQCVLYASVLENSSTGSSTTGYGILDIAVERLLDALVVIDADKARRAEVLYSLHYTQTGLLPSADDYARANNGIVASATSLGSSDRITRFAPPSLDLVFDDAVLKDVKAVWERLTRSVDGPGIEGQEATEASLSSSTTTTTAAAAAVAEEFMVFDDRLEAAEEEEDGHDGE